MALTETASLKNKTKLTNSILAKALPRDKAYKIHDEHSLYVLIYPSGKKVFRREFVFNSRRKSLTFGEYPYLSLEDARQKNRIAKNQALTGIDPANLYINAKKLDALNTDKSVADESLHFINIAKQWWQENMKTNTDDYATKVIRNLEKYVFPSLEKRLINKIKLPEIIKILEKIQDKGHIETAHRVSSTVERIFRYARQKGYGNVMIFDDDFKGALKPSKTIHFATFTKPRDVGLLLQKIDEFNGTHTVKCALLLAPLVFTRPGELRTALWKDIDFKNNIWKFKASKKKKDDLPEFHIVPLSRQAIEVLNELKTYSKGSIYIFPSHISRGIPMSGTAINNALRSLGYDTVKEITGHGFRAMARTLLREKLKFETEIIEQQLAHQVADTLGTAYNRTKFISDRIKMMQDYADYLDKLKSTDWSKIDRTVEDIYG